MPLANMARLKNKSDRESIINNWSSIAKTLDHLKMPLDNDMKRSIIDAGDWPMAIEILKDIQNVCRTWDKAASKGRKPDRTKPQTKLSGKPEQSIDINTIDPNEDLSESMNILHLTILSLCRHFNLAPKEASGLLAHGNRLLGQLLVKGLKQDFGPVQGWYTDLAMHADLIRSFMSDYKAASFALNLVKPGMLSQSAHVVRLACQVICLLAGRDFAESKRSEAHANVVWDWFADGGISVTLASMKKHPQVKDELANLL